MCELTILRTDPMTMTKNDVVAPLAHRGYPVASWLGRAATAGQNSKLNCHMTIPDLKAFPRSTFMCVTTLICLMNCGCQPRLDGGEAFSMAASALRDVRAAWLERGRTNDFVSSGIVGGMFSNVVFYTNSIKVDGRKYQCRFGVREDYWPPGVLAITDEGEIVWIRDRDGKATLAPHRRMIEP
jgi:hypothetical protein